MPACGRERAGPLGAERAERAGFPTCSRCQEQGLPGFCGRAVGDAALPSAAAWGGWAWLWAVKFLGPTSLWEWWSPAVSASCHCEGKPCGSSLSPCQPWWQPGTPAALRVPGVRLLLFLPGAVAVPGAASQDAPLGRIQTGRAMCSVTSMCLALATGACRDTFPGLVSAGTGAVGTGTLEPEACLLPHVPSSLCL